MLLLVGACAFGGLRCLPPSGGVEPISDAPVRSFSVTASTGSAVAGTPVTLTVDTGEPDFSGTILISTDDDQAQLTLSGQSYGVSADMLDSTFLFDQDYTFVPGDQGSKTLSLIPALAGDREYRVSLADDPEDEWASVILSVLPASPSAVQIHGSDGQASQSCETVFSVTLVDWAGNASIAQADASVSVTATAAAQVKLFQSQADCQNSVAASNTLNGLIPQASASWNFYLRAAAPGTVQLSASVTSGALSGQTGSLGTNLQ